MKKFQSIKDSIFGAKKGKEITEDDIDFLHHKMMVYYGYISLEEFKKMNLPMFWNLLQHINKMEEEQSQDMENMNKNIPKPSRRKR